MRKLGRSEIFLLKDVSGDLDAIAKAFFIEYVADVILDRPHADLQFRRDLFITQTARNSECHSIFSIS